ncbi:MAG: Crp/Fnr family transcriptional regulator [Candidatus Bipolaricaulaceae bacterium]
MPESAVELLRKVPLFSQFGDRKLRALLKTAKEREFSPGEPIVREGDASNVGFYLILEGQVEVKRGDNVLSRLGAGQFFGEMAVLDGAPRSADVVAAAPTRCLALTSWDFKALVDTYPDIAMGVIAELARRLRETSAALTD